MSNQPATPAQRQLEEWGVEIEELDFPPEVDQGIDAYAEIHQMGDLFDVSLLVRPGTPEHLRRSFADWAVSRIIRFAERGPDPDGWQHRSDGGWQLWVRNTYLGTFD